MQARAHRQIEDFLQSLRVERHCSSHTQQAYQRDLRKLAGFCTAAGIDHWARLDAAQVRRYASERHRRGISARTLQRELSAFRRFFHWLVSNGELKYNPAADVRAPKAARHLPEILDVDLTQHLLNADPGSPIEVRDHALLELFYSAGLRLSELAALNRQDLDLKAGLVEVIGGKGGKDRRLPVGKQARKALARWLELRETLVPPRENALFLTLQGRRMGVRGIQKRVRHWARKQGVDVNLHPHMLRHAFASHLLESSHDLRAVQELLGHEDIGTTQIYTHLDYQHLADIYDKAHPRAQRKKNKA